ncbi:EF-hand domain-containing protein [Winogradskyella ursingii]|uniref:hypothetical protein n=1 Tax=Winogradskyella ursingii TaxID=2686079 RepID=UPI0015CAFA00|nr:hypothetical protein [Winogradskyella ursingii]
MLKKKENIEKQFKNLDADAKGSISFYEFKVKRLKNESKTALIEKRCSIIDTNVNGGMEMAEFKATIL